MGFVNNTRAIIGFMVLTACSLMPLHVSAVYAEEIKKVDRGAVADPTRPQGNRQIGSGKKETRKRKTFVLSSIVFSDTRAQAVINGRFYQKGDRVNGAKLEKIFRDRIVIRDEFGARTLYWKQARSLRRE